MITLPLVATGVCGGDHAISHICLKQNKCRLN